MHALLPQSDRQEIALTITARTFYKVLLLILATTAILTVLRQTTYAFTLIIIAFFLALALNAPVSWGARHLPGKLHNNRPLATALSYLIVVGLLAVFLTSVVPPIVRETQSFIVTAPSTIQELQRHYGDINQFIVRYHLQGQVDQLVSQLGTQLQNATGNTFSAISGVLNSLFSIVSVLVLTFMMLIEGPTWVAFLRQLLPESNRGHVNQLVRDMYRAVRGYVNGQVVLAIIASVLILPGLLIFHVSYPFALMGLVFICGLIPLVGHTIGAITVSFIALFHSPFSALGILIYYILYQQIETYLIQPRLQANTTNLSPLLVLLSLLIGIEFAGLVGGLIAIPLAACLRVWVVDYLEARYGAIQVAMPGTPTKK